MTLDKRALRARMRATRDAFFATSPPPILAGAEFTALLPHAATVASYVPIGSEADPMWLARAAVEQGCAIVLPHVTSRAEPVRFLAWDADDDLAPGPYGLQQPHHASPTLAPDLVLTPLVAFDSALNRLGQGAGHYDRAFAEFPNAVRIGVAWSIQQVDTLPADPWDMPLHAIATETGWITR